MTLKRIAIFSSLALLVMALSAPSFAVLKEIDHAVNGVSATDNTALGGQAYQRVYAACDTAINNNNAACTAKQCAKPYSTNTNTNFNFAGYDSVTENMDVYCGGIDNIQLFSVWDGQVNPGTPAHQAYYGEASGLGSVSDTTVRGNRLSATCAGTVSNVCLQRLDPTTGGGQNLISNALHGFGGTDTVRNIGGLTPVPIPKIAGVVKATGDTTVTWDNPGLYTLAQKNGVATAVVGVNLYRFDDNNNNGICEEPNGVKTAQWVPVGQFGPTAGTVGTHVALPVSSPANTIDCTFFALTVRYNGPGFSGPAPGATIESGSQPDGTVFTQPWVGGHSQPVSLKPSVTKMVRVDARYEGRGSVKISWQSGIEGELRGFYLQRGATADGPYTRVSDMIAPKGDYSSYTAADRLPTSSGRVVYYRVEMLANDGNSSFSGTTAVMLPVRVKTGDVKGATTK